MLADPTVAVVHCSSGAGNAQQSAAGHVCRPLRSQVKPWTKPCDDTGLSHVMRRCTVLPAAIGA